MKNQYVDGALRRVLASRRVDVPEACPDANMLAAYLEARLSPDEATRFEEHASDCRNCQEMLALSLTLAEGEAEIAAQTAPAPQGFSYRSSPLRVALAAVAVLTVGMLLFLATKNEQMVQQRPQMAAREKRQNDVSGGAAAALSAPQATVVSSSSPAATPQPVPAEGEKQPAKAKDVAVIRPSRMPDAATSLTPPPSQRPLDAVAEVRPQVAAAADFQSKARAVAPQPAAGAAAEQLQKEEKGQRDVQALQENMAAARQTELRMQAGDTARQRADPAARGGGVQLALLPSGAAQAQVQAPGAAVEKRVRLAVQEAAANVLGTQMLGDRIFLRTPNYWVEVECTLHGEAPSREITRNSKAFSDMLMQETALSRLPSGLPVLLYWHGTKLLIR
jgi:hypothetical protein